MADVLILCIREEDKDDFVVEFIKGLMSRGLTVSYAGAFYGEEKEYVYDDVTNLPFLTSAYFREAKMKSKDFKTWKEFLENVDYEGIDAKLIIYVVMSIQDINYKALEDDFRASLEDYLKDIIVEIIRNSFMMSFSTFESHYPEIVEILGIGRRVLKELRIRAEESRYLIDEAWKNGVFGAFINNCLKIREEIEENGTPSPDALQKLGGLEEEYLQLMRKKNPTEEDLGRLEKVHKEYTQLENEIFEKGAPEEGTLEELKKSQEKLEIECFEDLSKSKELIWGFFGSHIIDRTVSNPERIMFFHISDKVPKKKILCIHYEESNSDIKENNLYFYPEKPTEGGDTGPIAEVPIPRSRILLDQSKSLYSPKTITEIVDNHVMFALHPPLIDICFPNNDFMLEVDSEEPEIGFLSKRINLGNCHTIQENLKVNTKLEERLWIYKYKKEKGRANFHEINFGDRKYSQKEDILILGRVEDLYRVLIADKQYGRYYQLIPPILKLLVFLAGICLALDILLMYGLDAPGAVSMFLMAAVGLSGTAFVLWALRTFVLSYLLEPMYGILKWSSYIFVVLMILSNAKPLIILSTTQGISKWSSYILLLGTLPKSAQIIMILSAFFMFFVILCGTILFADYIYSAVLYELNNLFGILKYNDTLEIENFSTRANAETVHVLRCGHFQTTVRKKNNVEVFFNSNLFPRIKWIYRKSITPPRKMAYSSGVFFSPLDKEKLLLTTDQESVKGLIYKKPETWKFWETIESLLFGKAELRPIDPDGKYSPSDRLVYFGEWGHVMDHIGSAIPVFPQSILFRNMVILTILSGLLFIIFSMQGISLTSPVEWTKNINSWGIILYLVTPLLWILLARKLRIRFWKGLLVLIFFLLLSAQPFPVIVVAIFVLLVFLFLLRFPLQQAYYSFRIWVNEKRKGNLVSIIYRNGNLRGTRIQKNILFTRIFTNDSNYIEEERVYFNKQFFDDIILSDEWEKIRENPQTQ